MKDTEVTALVEGIIFELRKELNFAVEYNVPEEDGSIGSFPSPYGILIKQRIKEVFKNQGYGTE